MRDGCCWWNALDKIPADISLRCVVVMLVLVMGVGGQLQTALPDRSLSVVSVSNNNPQPCPENPIVLAARDTPQYVHSPYTYEKLYPPDCDCKFILMSTSANHRIRLVVIDSQLEEPLFGECNDYCAVYDGNSTKATMMARWCGTSSPLALSGQGDTLFVHFRSDPVVEKRGFNISFVEYELGTCPPDWLPDRNQIFCYRLYTPIHSTGYTWTEAQHECAHERANLLSFENLNEYDFIYDTFSTSHTAPWIAYNDVSAEGTFRSVVPDEPLWPDKLPYFGEHDESDCVYLDWNRREHVAYAIDDCRDRRAFICKKRRDGSTTPALVMTDFVRSGLLHNRTTNWLIILLLLILLLLLCLALGICGWRGREWYRRQRAVVGVIDRNQQLVGGTAPGRSSSQLTDEDKRQKEQQKSLTLKVPRLREAQATIAKVESLQKQQQQQISDEHQESGQLVADHANQIGSTTIQNQTGDPSDAYCGAYDDEAHSPRINLAPNQPVATPLPSSWAEEIEDAREAAEHEMAAESSRQLSAREVGDQSEIIDEEAMGLAQSASLAGGIGKPVISANGDDLELEQFKLAHQKQMDTAGIRREVTGLTTATATSGMSGAGGTASTAGGGGVRSRLRRKSFERPHVSMLDSVSAISLDEFWHKGNE